MIVIIFPANMESLLSKVTSPLSTSLTTSTEYEIFLTDASQLDELEDWCRQQQQQNHQQQQQQHPPIHLRLAQRLFGPPRISLSWKQRCHLFQLLQSGKIPNLASITIHGTTMGQVISAELLSTGIPSSLCSLTMETGLIFDEPSSVQQLAHALHRHPQLQNLQLYNFLNHVRPIQVPPIWLLDPLLHALGTCPQLQTLELACLASFLEWKVPLLSSPAIQFFLTHTPHLRKLQWTNLGLTDVEFITMAEAIPHLTSLQQVVVNGNENTIVGLRRLVLSCLSLGSTITHLEVMNHVKLSEDLYDYIVWYTEQYSCPLQYFEVTFPLRIDPTLLRLQLRLHQLQLAQRYYSPNATTTTKLQVLGQVSDDPNCLFRLLQQQPNLIMGRSKPPLPTTTTVTNKKNYHNHHHNHQDDILSQSSLLLNCDDHQHDETAAIASPTTIPPKCHCKAPWILPVTSGIGRLNLLLVLLFVLFLSLVPRTDPKNEDFQGSLLPRVEYEHVSILYRGDPNTSGDDSFPWNHSNQQCLTVNAI